VIADVDLDGRALDATQRIAFFQRVLTDTRELPGVQSATLSMIPELTGANAQMTFFREGAAAPGDSTPPDMTYFNAVGADHHRTLGIPMVRGRDIAASDVAGSPGVAIVNETFAARQWPGEDAIGKRFSLEGPTGPWVQVVGVARNVKYHTLGEGPKPFAVLPFTQVGARRMAIEARLRDGASSREVGAAITGLVRTLDPVLAPPAAQLLTEAQRIVLLPAKLSAAVLGGIGLLAFLLAAVGVAGVSAYTVTRRTREIGVRIALGARSGDVLRGVLRDTWRTVIIGSVAGLLLAMALGRVIASQLYGVSFLDPLTFSLVPLLLVAMALVAVALPARRAVSVPPTEALRTD
jgi:predicted permease